MKVENKKWDSEFFNLRIGYVEVTSQQEATELASMRDSLRNEYDLIYVFDPERIGFSAEGAKLVDEKILYTKLCQNRILCGDVCIYNQSKPDDALYYLALVSGGFSRFKLDECLPKGSYERLYRRWIENECANGGADNKIIFVERAKRGMVTVSYEKGKAQIGLVAVSLLYQHQGIGTKIISTLENYLFRKGVHTIDVATQLANKDACCWYEKNGFVIKSISNIYHWWL